MINSKELFLNKIKEFEKEFITGTIKLIDRLIELNPQREHYDSFSICGDYKRDRNFIITDKIFIATILIESNYAINLEDRIIRTRAGFEYLFDSFHSTSIEEAINALKQGIAFNNELLYFGKSYKMNNEINNEIKLGG